MTRHPVAAYYMLACALSWAAWFPLVAAHHGFNVPTIPYHHYLGACGPILAAFIVAALSTGRAGVLQLARGMMRWHVSLGWLLIALFGPAVLYGLSAVGTSLFSNTWPDVSQFGRSDEFPGLGVVAVWLVQTLTFGVGEEVGWRGFALPRLQAKHNAFSATLLLTCLWALWHIPAFFYRPGYLSMGAGEIVGWLFSLLTGAILLTWLYNSTKGSILIVALFHGSIDVAFTSNLIDIGVMNAMGVLIVLWAIVVVWRTGPAQLSRVVRQQVMPGGPARSPGAERSHPG